ncbi:type II CAAX endopeptidase family protein [Thermomonas sp.]|jgi:membrane protease YdiL (CAAX protease family)|uniref:CPBP family intramembrane glutamic endopeptidase n=1 Tax=Thermomonas sp. TaxID=1971895 RepID=UPI001B5586CA|nr:type II CAAX endopeptidase family protein [Thermomonas sp.]MBK6333126.1 CPBP family intramembrane metalloprotease [Thermomonas sp.]MBK6417266.1 CPBP family intramembrane metalloprotease [Thermomonas sp.]MBK6924501.1 CPBP family intramembrane metalloprotease [Thermomonas sp.]MBK7206363.1 CPBP family intramembrane metalloprotease [Thermomonas sp.]MBK9668616.1 CPBP family intramembrane metalloprotease [Thermomonas sp.]
MSRVALYSPEPARGWLPWIWLVPILMILFNAVPVIALDDWMEARQWSTPRGDPIGLPGLHALLWIGFVPTLLLVLAWVRFVERRSLASIGLVGPAPLKTFAQGLAIGMGTIALVVSAIWAAGGLRATGWGLAWQSPQSLLQVALLLPGFMLQSSVEEVMFRGWMQSVLARKAGVAVAVVLVALVFTLLHFSPNQRWLVMLSSFLFSLFASAWALRTGNVWGVMGWHAGWNWLLATGFELPVTGIDAQLPALLVALQPSGVDALTGGAEGPEGSYLCSVFFILAIARIGARRTGRGSR